MSEKQKQAVDMFVNSVNSGKIPEFELGRIVGKLESYEDAEEESEEEPEKT